VTQLPSGWAETTLGDLAAPEPFSITDGPFGSSLKTEHYVASGARVIRLTNIGNGSFLDDDAAYIAEAHFAHLLKHQALPGDLVTAALGDPLGRTCIIPEGMGLAIVKADCFRFRCHPLVNKDYLHGWLNSPQARQNFVERGHGIGRLRINLNDYRVTPVLLPPDTEQRRIVAKLDTLSSRSKWARAELDRIDPLILRTKKAILHKTFTGELTSAWRAERGLPEPPTVSLRELCLSITDGDHQAPPRSESGVPFITISAMNDGRIQLSKATRYVPTEYTTQLSSARRPALGDVLYSVTGSIGIPALITTSETFVFQRHIAILKPDLGKTTGWFVATVLGAPQIMEQALAVATGTAQLTIPLSGLRNFRVPLPTELEQAEIIRRVGAVFTKLDRLAAESRSATALWERLDQAILAKAFGGELMPQDPSDEPAPVLLERVRADQTKSRLRRVQARRP